MRAVGDLRVRYVYLYVLVVGMVMITKGKRAKIPFIETNNLLLWRKFGMIKNFTCGLYQEVYYHVCQLLHEPYNSIHVYEPYILAEFVELHLPLEMGVFPIFQLSWLLGRGIIFVI